MVLMFRAESQENFSVSKKDSRPNNIVIPEGDSDYFNMVVIAKKLQGEILIFLQKWNTFQPFLQCVTLLSDKIRNGLLI